MECDLRVIRAIKNINMFFPSKVSFSHDVSHSICTLVKMPCGNIFNDLKMLNICRNIRMWKMKNFYIALMPTCYIVVGMVTINL